MGQSRPHWLPNGHGVTGERIYCDRHKLPLSGSCGWCLAEERGERLQPAPMYDPAEIAAIVARAGRRKPIAEDAA